MSERDRKWGLIEECGADSGAAPHFAHAVATPADALVAQPVQPTSTGQSFRSALSAGLGAGVMAYLISSFTGGRFTYWVFLPPYLLFLTPFRGIYSFVATLVFSIAFVLGRIVLGVRL